MATAVAAIALAATGASTGTAIAVTAAAAVADLALSSAYSKKQQQDAQNKSAKAPRDVTIRSAVSPANIVYGQARVSGPIVYANTRSTPQTNDNHTLWMAIALANHACDSIVSVWIDGDEILANQIDASGNVTSGKFGPISGNHVTNFYFRLGSDGVPTFANANVTAQGAITELVNSFSDLNLTDHRGRGMTYMASAFELGTRTGEGVWKDGAPRNVRAVVKGKKVYDPRKDSTNGGSGTHRLTDATTWEWSDNPALCLADYLIDDRLGMGVEGISYDDIDWSMVATAATACDVTVSTPAGNQKRFTCNGVLTTDTTYAENIKAILGSMMGSITWSGGKYRIRAGVDEAASFTFTEDDIVGDIQVQPELGRTQRFNKVRGRFIDPAQDYAETEFLPVSNATYKTTRDNGLELTSDITLPLVNNEYQAQRIAYKAINLNAQQMSAIIPVNWKGLKVAVGDRINVVVDELGWTSPGKKVIVDEWSFDPDQGFVLKVRETSSDAFADPASGDYSTRSYGGEITFAAQPVSPPSDLSATGEEEAVVLSWSAPLRPSSYDEIIVYRSATSNWSGAAEIGRTRGTTFRHETTYADGTHYYWVRSVDVDGEESIRNPNNDTTGVSGRAGRITTTQLDDDANFALTADWPSVTDSLGTAPDDNATDNGYTIDGDGNIAGSINTETTGDIHGGQTAYDSGIGYFLGYDTNAYKFSIGNSSGNKLTFDGSNLSVTGAITANSGSIASTVTIGGTQASTVVSGAADGATALQNGDDITDGTIGGVTITSTKLYQGAGTFQGSTTGFYLDSAGQFSLKDKFSFDGTELFVDGNIEVSDYVRAGTGSNTAIISGRDVDEFAFWAGAGFQSDGGPSGGNAPFRVTRDGKVIMTNFALYSQSGTKLFDSQDGLLALPQTAVAQASGTLVPQVSEELTSGTDTFTVTLSSTQTITANFSYPVGALYYSGTSLANALSNVSSAFAVTIEYSSDSGSTWNTFGSTQNFTRVTSGTPTSSQFFVDNRELTISIIYGTEPTTIYIASLQSDRGAIDEGMALVGSTSQSLGAGTYLIRMAFSATGGSGTGAPSTTKTREVRLSTSGSGFTVSDGTVSDGVGTSATTGWVLQNFVEKTESDNVTINGTLTLGGDLVVNGTTTTINSTTLEIDDKNITLASGAANATAANGAGITIDGADATLTYDSSSDAFEFNKPLGIGIAPAFRLHAYHPTTNVVARFESGDSDVWIDLHDSNSGNYGALIGHNSSMLFRVADASVNDRMTLNNSGLLNTDAGYSVGGTTVINSSTVGSLSQLNVINSSTPTINIYDNGNGGGGGASGKLIFQNTNGDAIGIGYTGDSTADSDLIISTNAGGTYGGYLGLDAGAINDTKADIILEPLTQVLVSSAPLKISNSVFGEHLLLHREDATNSSSIKFTNTAGTAGILYGRHSDNELVWRDGTTTNNFMLWHQGNDGPDSGLDADTVDGFDASSFLRSDASDNFSGDFLEFQDNKVLRFGNSADYRIWHDGGGHTYFRNYGAGTNTYFQNEDNANVNHAMIYLRGDTSAPYVQLYYDGGEVLRTSSGGVTITNNITSGGINTNSTQVVLGGSSFSNMSNAVSVAIGSAWMSSSASLFVNGFSRYNGALYISDGGPTNYVGIGYDNGKITATGGNGSGVLDAFDAPDGYYVGNVAVIDSSRSLLNLSGTVKSDSTFNFLTGASGAQYGKFYGLSVSSTYTIGSYGGYFNAQNGYMVGNTTIVDSSRNLTNISQITADDVRVTAGDGEGYGFWSSALGGSYRIYMSASGNATYGGRVTGEASSDYNMYFKMQSGTNRGFVFRDNTNNYFSINPGGVYSEVLYRDPTVTRPYITASGTSGNDDQLLTRWRYANADTYYLDLNQRVTSSQLRWAFSVHNNGSNWYDRLVFKNGFVGIGGLQDPAYALDVSGSSRFSSTLLTQNYIDSARGMIGGYNTSSGTGGSWGACIWSIGPSWNGSGVGTNYSIGTYGLHWIRQTHASEISFADEGLYLTRASTTPYAALGRAGAYFATRVASTGNITAYYSDERLKDRTGVIENALAKVQSLEGFTYRENELARELGYNNNKEQVGLSAQQVKAVLPHAVSLAPVDFGDRVDGEIVSKSGEDYLTVDYSRLVPLLVESIKELSTEVERLKKQLEKDNGND